MLTRWSKFGRYTIPYAVGTVTPEALAKGDPINLQMRRNSDGSVYLMGIYVPDKKANTKATYVARVNPDGKPGWMKTLTFAWTASAKCLMPIPNLAPLYSRRRGLCCCCARHPSLSPHQSPSGLSNEKEKRNSKIKLKERNHPRRLLYVEKRAMHLSCCSKAMPNRNYITGEPITLLSINAIGDVSWRRKCRNGRHCNRPDGTHRWILIAGNYTHNP